MSNYIPADMATINYGHPPEVWKKLQDYNTQHLKQNPICEICKKRSSVRITPLGKILAACLECIEHQRQMLIQSYEESLRDYE